MFHLSDLPNWGTFIGVLAIYGELRVMKFQHVLMWKEYAKQHGISDTDESKSAA